MLTICFFKQYAKVEKVFLSMQNSVVKYLKTSFKLEIRALKSSQICFRHLGNFNENFMRIPRAICKIDFVKMQI